MLRYTATKLPIADIEIGALAQSVSLEFQRVQNAINLNGGQNVTSRTVTANDTVSSTDGMVYGDTTSNTVTLTLPFASEYSGMIVGFKQSAGGNTYTVQVNPHSSDAIITATPSSVASLVVTGTAIRLHSDGIATWQQI